MCQSGDGDDYETNYHDPTLLLKAMEMEDSESELDELERDWKEVEEDGSKVEGVDSEEKDRFYELSSDGSNEIIAPGSVRLPIYAAEIGGLPRKAIIDSCDRRLEVKE